MDQAPAELFREPYPDQTAYGLPEPGGSGRPVRPDDALCREPETYGGQTLGIKQKRMPQRRVIYGGLSDLYGRHCGSYRQDGGKACLP